MSQLMANMSYFAKINDYRPFLSAHLQFLAGLCQQSIRHVNDTVRSFLSTSLTTSRLLSEASFDLHLTSLLNQARASIQDVFTHTLQLVQAINHGNALMSVHGSNYRYLVRGNRSDIVTVLYTLPVMYGGATSCTCGLESRCTQPAAFIWPAYVPIKGFLQGCLPSESFLASTLECFFELECINLIRSHMLATVRVLRFLFQLYFESSRRTERMPTR